MDIDTRTVAFEPVGCHCGAEMVLRAEGVERAIPSGTGTVEFRGYVCPVCGAGRRYEYEAAADSWRRADR